MDEIREDLDTAMRLRTLQTVSISGGEPTLHPRLLDVIRMIKKRRLLAMMLTNGVLIDRDYLRRLKDAGLDFVLFHVDPWQKRPDLPAEPTWNDVFGRFRELTEAADDCGIDASVSLTIPECSEEILTECTEFLLESPGISFLFLTRGEDPGSFYREAIRVKESSECWPFHDRRKKQLRVLRTYYRKRYGFEPFAFIPDSEGKDSVWVSYFIPVIYMRSGKTLFQFRSNVVDVWLIKAARILSGRYTQKVKQRALITLLRMFLNSISTFRFVSFMRFTARLLLPGARLRHKVIVYDNGPHIGENGKIISCEYCTVAVVSKGRLVKCCWSSFEDAKQNAPARCN
jgi:hypothetical protein